jgi:hypothetical protein
MIWTPIADLDDRTLAHAAAQRSLVQLANGRVARLVMWPIRGVGRRTGGRGRYARCATQADTRFNVPCSAIVAVELPQPSP